MFAKLLKYDLTHYIKLWLVGAVSVVVFGAVGGWCHRLQPHVPEFAGDDFLRMMLGSMSVISIISIVAFMILGVVLVLMRYAKNCFSDEAYLTFTLPVKRGSVFNAKLVSAAIYVLATLIIAGVSLSCYCFCASPESFFRFFEKVGEFFAEVYRMTGAKYFYLYGITFVVLAILYFAYALNVMFFCVTFAGTMVKKNRVLLGVGVYYIISAIKSVIELLCIVGFFYVIEARGYNADIMYGPILTLLVLVAVWLFGIVSALYFAQLHLLDKKLNLA